MPGKRDNSSNDLSEFEKQRLANIAERDALLKKLTLEAQSSGLLSPASVEGRIRRWIQIQEKNFGKEGRYDSGASSDVL